VAVETLLEPLLVQVVAHETSSATQDKETVQGADLHVVLSLVHGEGARAPHQINKADGDAAIHVEDQVLLLGRGDLLHLQGEIQDRVAGEVLLHILCQNGDPEIWVVLGLDAMSNAEDELVLLPHGLDELVRGETLVKSLGELQRSAIKSATKPVTL